MNDANVLAFDLGATSGRAILGSLAGGKLALTEIHRFPNEPVGYNGELHWDAPRLWHEIQIGLRHAGSLSIQSIGVDTWGVDYALLGEHGALLDNPFHYRDHRTEGRMEEVLAILGKERVYEATGIQFLPINTLYQLYAAWQKSPRLLESAHSLVTTPDLLNYWLTGVIRCEYTNASTTQLLDRRTRDWDRSLLTDLGIPVHMLSPVVQPGTPLGNLRPEIARAAGMAPTLVTVPACHDTGSAIAAIRSGGATAYLSSGTWSLLGTEVPSPVVTPESLRYNFTNEGGVGNTIRLLKNITGLWILESCRRAWKDSGDDVAYPALMEMAKAAAPLRSLFDPNHASFTAPESMPAAIEEYCRHTGQPVPNTKGAFVRAVLESLALKYREVLEQLGDIVGTKFDTLRVIGGGCRNTLLNQFTANATGCRVLAGPVEATALGNIAMQLVASGLAASIDDARDLIERSFPSEVVEPVDAAGWDRAAADFRDLSMERHDRRRIRT